MLSIAQLWELPTDFGFVGDFQSVAKHRHLYLVARLSGEIRLDVEHLPNFTDYPRNLSIKKGSPKRMIQCE